MHDQNKEIAIAEKSAFIQKLQQFLDEQNIPYEWDSRGRTLTCLPETHAISMSFSVRRTPASSLEEDKQQLKQYQEQLLNK